jgi:hypothetical protein
LSDVLAQVKPMLANTAGHWTALTSTLPDELLTRPAAPGEWSAAQCLGHLLDTEAMVFPVRLRVFLEGGDSFPNFDPDTEGRDYSGMTPAQMGADFARQRKENLTILDRMTPEMLGRTATHSALGPVTLAQLLNEWVAHDLNHTIQAERALMQPFIPASGPWRDNFADHDLGG